MMNQSMQGKTCVITGGTDGIGLVAARELALLGARLLLIGKNAEKGARAVAGMRAVAGHGGVEFLCADLSSQTEVRGLASLLRARAGRIDVLINNAGAIFIKRQQSVDGIEMTFALNQLAYFLLTDLLLDLLTASAPARIVNVASATHASAALDLDDVQMRRGYSGMKAYSNSKLANILFSNELARRLAGRGVTVNSLHPGYVNTNFGQNNSRLERTAMAASAKLFAISPEAGARTSIYLAASPQVAGVSGKYFFECRETRPSPAALDHALGARLWALCAEMTGVAR